VKTYPILFIYLSSSWPTFYFWIYLKKNFWIITTMTQDLKWNVTNTKLLNNGPPHRPQMHYVYYIYIHASTKHIFHHIHVWHTNSNFHLIHFGFLVNYEILRKIQIPRNKDIIWNKFINNDIFHLINYNVILYGCVKFNII
jgi:hypothetical protein